MTAPLSSLLYYDLSTIKHGEIRKGFKEYQLLLSALIEAVKAYESGDLERFDALVGENACQIRAVRMALIHNNNSFNTQLKEEALRVKDEISELLDKKINSLMRGESSLGEILRQYDLEVFLGEDELFALKSFVLSEAKEGGDLDLLNPTRRTKQRCSPDKMQKFGSDVSSHFLRKLSSHLRQQLSQSSVQFVQQTAFHLQDRDLVETLSDDFLYDHNSLSCLPMFWTYKALLRCAKANDIPLIARVKLMKQVGENHVVIDERSYFFKPVRDSLGHWHYNVTVPTEEDLAKAACVIEGVADCSGSILWNEKALTDSIVRVILAGAADHRQYPNSQHYFQVKNLEYFFFKSMAQGSGFSLENPTSFFIQHVYTSQVNKQFSAVEHNEHFLFSNAST